MNPKYGHIDYLWSLRTFKLLCIITSLIAESSQFLLHMTFFFKIAVQMLDLDTHTHIFQNLHFVNGRFWCWGLLLKMVACIDIDLFSDSLKYVLFWCPLLENYCIFWSLLVLDCFLILFLFDWFRCLKFFLMFRGMAGFTRICLCRSIHHLWSDRNPASLVFQLSLHSILLTLTMFGYIRCWTFYVQPIRLFVNFHVNSFGITHTNYSKENDVNK